MSTTIRNRLVYATTVALTGSYADPNTSLSSTTKILTNSEHVAMVYVTYVTGAAETNNTLSWKVEFSPDDGTTWIQEKVDTVTSTIITSSDVEHQVSGVAAATTYTDRCAVPLTGRNMRIKVKETGVAANYGTVSIVVVLGENGIEAYNRALQSISMAIDEFPAAAAVSADDQAAPTTTSIYSYGMVFDGSTWDRIRGDSSRGLKTYSESATAATEANVSNSASNFTVFSSNANAKGRTIYNDSATSVDVKFGATATSTSFTVRIGPSGYYEFPTPLYTGQVDAIADAATGALRTTEW